MQAGDMRNWQNQGGSTPITVTFGMHPPAARPPLTYFTLATLLIGSLLPSAVAERATTPHPRPYQYHLHATAHKLDA